MDPKWTKFYREQKQVQDDMHAYVREKIEAGMDPAAIAFGLVTVGGTVAHERDIDLPRMAMSAWTIDTGGDPGVLNEDNPYTS